MSSRDVEDMTKLGSPAPFVCPSCSGALWEIQNGDLIRYRCHVGHAYSPENLLLEQAGAIEGALYSALRALEEKAGMQRRMASKYFEELPHYRAEYERRAAEANASADVIRQLLESQKH